MQRCRRQNFRVWPSFFRSPPFLLLFFQKVSRHKKRNQATEGFLKFRLIVILITVPCGSPHWDYFLFNAFLRFIEPSQQFLKRYEELFGKKALITFLPFFLTRFIAGIKSASPETIIAISYKFS